MSKKDSQGSMYEVGVSDGAYILVGLVRLLPPPYSQLRFC